MGQKEVPEGAEQAVPPLTPELHVSAPESEIGGITWLARVQELRLPVVDGPKLSEPNY